MTDPGYIDPPEQGWDSADKWVDGLTDSEREDFLHELDPDFAAENEDDDR